MLVACNEKAEEKDKSSKLLSTRCEEPKEATGKNTEQDKEEGKH